MLIAASCSGVEPAPEPTKDIFSSSTGMSPAQMEKARAESAAEQDAEATKIAEDRSKQRAESDAKDDARRAAAAESDAQTTADRAAWLKDVKASEAKAAAERAAEFNKFMAAAAQAQADQEKADQEKAEEDKAAKPAKPQPRSGKDDKEDKDDNEDKGDKGDKGDTDEQASDDEGDATDEDFEIALLFVRDILNARFPTFNPILNDEDGAAVMKKYGLDPTSAESILDGILLAAHEGGHGYDGANRRVELDDGRGCDQFYLITVLTKPFTTSWGELEAGDWLDPTPCGMTYPNSTDYVSGISRATILLDSQNYKRPPKDCTDCILSPHDGDGEWGSDDMYSTLYLSGAPEAGKITHYKEGYPGFDPDFIVPSDNNPVSGDQAYGMLFEETVQYVNSLAWAYSRHDLGEKQAGGSQKTAVLLWLWWNERYLKLTRENYPEEHAEWMKYYAEPFLWVWGKAWRYLDTPSMTYREDRWNQLIELVTDDLMLGEVQYVRELYHGDAYNRGSELTASILSKDPDGITWEGPVLSGPPLIIDSESTDGIYFATMPGGFTETDSEWDDILDRQGLADISEYIDKYDARLSVAEGGYGNIAESDKGDTDEQASGPGGAATDDFDAALLYVRDVMNARYPTGNVILNDEEGAAVMKEWGVDTTSAESILGNGMILALHEGGHFYNVDRKGAELDDGRGCETYFYMTLLTEPFTTSWGELEAGDKLEIAPCGLTYPNSSDYFMGISRSTILLDSQNHKRPPHNCDECLLSPHDEVGEFGWDERSASIYLPDAPHEGKITHYKEGFPGFDPSFTVPANDTWDGGDQAFDMLFEEFVQYVNTLAWGYSRHDYDGGTITGHKTTMLTFLWWSERYLKLTREYYPEEHAHWMEYYAEPFLYMWGKAWRYLDTPSMSYAEEDYDNLIQLVTDDLMLGEVQYVRELYHNENPTSEFVWGYERGSELAAPTLNADPDGITWEGPTLSGIPMIVDSASLDGIYFATMPGGFTEVDSDRQGLADISGYMDLYNAHLSIADGGYGNTAD